MFILHYLLLQAGNIFNAWEQGPEQPPAPTIPAAPTPLAKPDAPPATKLALSLASKVGPC